jgi:hypothetical protein
MSARLLAGVVYGRLNVEQLRPGVVGYVSAREHRAVEVETGVFTWPNPKRRSGRYPGTREGPTSAGPCTQVNTPPRPPGTPTRRSPTTLAIAVGR